MKLKPYQDAEATVLEHIEGKGKYKGMLGSIQVRTLEGIVFKIGSGFSDNERNIPPPIGSTITFKYIGKTQNGVPKFASFLRIREAHP
jgi:DNA ligase-1